MKRNVYKGKEVFLGVLAEVGFIIGMMGIFGSVMIIVMR